jgi:O-antigen ligase
MNSVDGSPMRRKFSLASIPTVLLVASLATLVQSYIAIKLAFLTLFLFAAVIDGAFQETIRVYPRLICFYLMVGIIGIVWAFVGLFNQETYFEGVTDAVRLYIVWSAVFVVLYTLLRSQSSLQFIHRGLIVAGILISLMNFAGVLDQISHSGVVPESVSKELHQGIGLHDGYIQITSQNIASLFFLVPYLISVQVRADSVEAKSIGTKLSLMLCLILTVISGRRALLLVVALTPFTILFVSALSGNLGLIKVGARRLFLGYTIVLAVGIGAAAIQSKFLPELLYVQHIQDAFSAADERTIQKPFLIEGFERSPIIGLGFGAAVGYQRSADRPWIYELTYYQMLLHAGLLGVSILGALILSYGVFITSILRTFKPGSAVPFGLIVGVISLLIGANSNPYLASFDLLFFVGFLPYLSTFSRGFTQVESGR